MLSPREPRSMMIVPSWIEAHCAIPDGFRAGAPLRLYDGQLLYLGNFYLVKGSAVWVPENPILAPSFVYRRGLLVGPQKIGKNPTGAAHICAEAEGPVVFAGWAGTDEGYACAEHGCGCGWEYAYDPGEPMGIQWPAPLIQVTAFSEDQTDNTWKVLRPMIEKGPLANLIPHTGERFIRLRNPEDEALIEVVTSSEQSRLGARASFVLQDQLEQWWASNGMAKVADAQYRNLAGTGGRASLLANAWDPSQNSVAQREWDASATDLYRQSVWPPAKDGERDLDFTDPIDRRRIFEAVYPLDVRREGGGHVDLDSIEAEAAAILAYDAPQARRYFGNEIVQGLGKAFDVPTWTARRASRPHEVPAGALITIGGDGSRLWDHFSIIATEVASGYQWPLGIWIPNGKELALDGLGGPEEILEHAFATWNVWRAYFDPPYIESWVAKWAGKWGKDRVVEWFTSRPKAMAYGLRAWKSAMTSGELSHCPADHPFCALFSEHVSNAIRRETGYRDDEGQLWTVEKETQLKKIDSVPAAALSWEARLDAITAGALNTPPTDSAYDGLTAEQILERMLG